MNISYRFEPDGDRARFIDSHAHAALADSLAHIVERSRGVLADSLCRSLQGLIASLRAGRRYGPDCFGRYYLLAQALMDDRLDDAASVIDLICRSRPIDGRFRLLALDEPAIADCGDLYRDLMDTDPNTAFSILAPSSEAASAFRLRFERVYGMMAEVMPELAREFAAIISQVCMVVGDSNANYQFDGGSSYMLWGGLFLNIASHETDLQLAEVLAHESGHSLLFGYSLDEALILNADDELYQSPLRIDPRPMDGIYHATYVSARMHWAMSRMLASGRLSEEDRARAEAARAEDRKNFENGYAVVGQHARMTATGRTVMNEACRYMEAAKPR